MPDIIEQLQHAANTLESGGVPPNGTSARHAALMREAAAEIRRLSKTRDAIIEECAQEVESLGGTNREFHADGIRRRMSMLMEVTMPDSNQAGGPVPAIHIANIILPGHKEQIGFDAAIAIVKSLAAAGFVVCHKSKLGAVSDLPAEDQAALDKAYGATKR
jgi:hypothetical protein